MLLTHAGHGAGASGVDAAALLASIGLGLFHGINPAMGWLFALSYGLQEKSRRSIVRSLAWIVLGHEAAVLPSALIITLFASQVSRNLAMGVVTAALLVFGLVLLLRPRHFRWVGMRLRPWQLAWWSFLMSTVTGAGLMLAPVLLHTTGNSGHAHAAGSLTDDLGAAVQVALVHAAGMAFAAGVVALLVYQTVGLRILRTHWVNLDRVWAIAFVVAALGVAAAWFGLGS
ncbi:hypothetical protein [Ornithinimicrobium pratense]|uniref:Arginine/ornithine antiporter ArcD n=1 Tax=Ornithinimicrobium pratense TaxID=2593973 RepID=A0A5J6V8X6_9MICO|nr:hypothetical protein [Ornithinimicrobium pratense]QFG69636.1 hypothetical protein FY030_13820 [Ornithinimicrobium pratense]